MLFIYLYFIEVNYDLGYLHRLYVGSISDVSKVYAAYIFRMTPSVTQTIQCQTLDDNNELERRWKKANMV